MSKKPGMARVLPGSMLGFSVDRGTGYRAERVEGSGFIPIYPSLFPLPLPLLPILSNDFPGHFPTFHFP
jgi:hypothetical protein